MKKKIIKINAFIVILLILFIGEIHADSNTNKKLLIIDNSDIWEYKDDGWYEKNNFDSNSFFLVYIDNKYYGMYKLKKVNNYYLYDNNKNMVSYNGKLFAYSNSFEINNKNFNVDNISNLNEINSILGMNLNNNDLSLNERVIIDLDNNGVNDEIINVSNLDAQEEQTKYFNLVYVKLNNVNRQILINDTISEKEVLNAPIYKIKYIFKVNNNVDNVIFEEGYFSDAGETKNIMYESVNGSYNKVVVKTEKEKKNRELNNKSNYTMYIVLAIILIFLLLGCLVFNKIKNSEFEMDD